MADLTLLHIIIFLLLRCFSSVAIELTEKETILESWDILTSYSQANEWPNLSRNRAIAIRTQRDVSVNNTIAYTVVPGVDLNTVVFDQYGYNSTSLDSFKTLMNVGIQSFVLHLYYDETHKNWLLCPKEKIIEQSKLDEYTECAVNDFNLTSLVSTLNSFMLLTNNDLNINIMYLLLKLESFSFSRNQTISTSLRNSSIDSLSTVFETINKVVSPLSIDNNNLPTLHDLLYKLSQRVFPIVIEDQLNYNTSYNLLDDKYSLFVGSNNDSKSISNEETNVLSVDIQEEYSIECQTIESSSAGSYLRFSYDTETYPYDLQSYWESIQCGYSPIISHSFDNLSDISSFLEISLWSWVPYQPTITTTDELSIPEIFQNLTTRNIHEEFNSNTYSINITSSLSKHLTGSVSNYTSNNRDENEDFDDEYNNRCAVISRSGWVATTCDRKLYAICINSKNSSDYQITSEKRTYTKADLECQSLDGDYELTVPRNTLQQDYMMSLIPDDESALWINLNSLSSKNCWVVGIDSTCPYQSVISHHIFVQMITPSSVMGFLLFVLFLFMQFQQLPVHKNRKYWKKLLNEKLKNDYDGVPS